MPSIQISETEDEKTKKIKGVLYSIPFSKEVEFNFEHLRNLPFVFSDEILNNKTAIPIPLDGTNKKTLFLDLDETLIHTIDPNYNYSSIGITHKKIQILTFLASATKLSLSLKIVIRPYAVKFLEELSDLYEIIVRSFPDIYYRFLQLHAKNMQIQY
jgi:TFIIF-interacting CTD phosphatase-like protein